jgi:hypothetical protein
MGLPMRYPRFFIVLFVAFGLAALPAARAAAADADPLPEALRQIDTLAEIEHHATIGAELARRSGAVELLAQRVGLDHTEADRLLDAMTARVVSVTGAGERAGLLNSPEIDALFDAIVEIVRSGDPQSDRAFAKADFLTERSIAAKGLREESERTAMIALVSDVAVTAIGPVERWRPLVEQYFAPDRVDEAMSIIDCESNGDPTARNPRSSAAGLFQFLDRTWSHSSEQAGFQGVSPLSPEANIAAAAWLVEYSLGAGDSPWAHWTCQP